jgi:hypothetical protein
LEEQDEKDVEEDHEEEATGKMQKFSHPFVESDAIRVIMKTRNGI